MSYIFCNLHSADQMCHYKHHVLVMICISFYLFYGLKRLEMIFRTLALLLFSYCPKVSSSINLMCVNEF